MKTDRAKPASPRGDQKLQALSAQALAADKLAKTTKQKARLAKGRFKSAKQALKSLREAFRAARKAAKKASKEAKRLQNALQGRLDRLVKQKKIRSKAPSAQAGARSQTGESLAAVRPASAAQPKLRRAGATEKAVPKPAPAGRDGP
jgi:hypothetical protein